MCAQRSLAYNRRQAKSYITRDAAWWKGFRKAIYHPEHQMTDIQSLVAGMNGEAIETDTKAEQRSFRDGFDAGTTMAMLARQGQFPDIERHLMGGTGIERAVDATFDKAAQIASDPVGEVGDAVEYFLRLVD